MINIKCGTPVSNDVQITHDNGKEIPGVIALDIKARPFEVITATLDINVNNINTSISAALGYIHNRQNGKFHQGSNAVYDRRYFHANDTVSISVTQLEDAGNVFLLPGQSFFMISEY